MANVLREFVRVELERRQLSQNALARAVGVDPPTVSRWLHPETPMVPSPESCGRLAEYLGLAPEDVLRAAGHLQAANGRPRAEPLGEDIVRALAMREVASVLDGVPRERWPELVRAFKLIGPLASARRPRRQV